MIRVGLTRDLFTGDGTPSFGAGPLGLLDGCAGLQWEVLPDAVAEIGPEHAARYDALYINAARVTAAGVGGGDRRLKLVARHGVGYDAVDVPALTAAGILLTNTPQAVQRPVATMAITFVLALAQRLLEKDRLTRAGGWQRRADFMGRGLTGKTLGIVGAGGTGRETMRLARAFDMRLVATGPRVDAAELAPFGAQPLPLDELLAQSDFVVLTCRLDASTHHLIDSRRLALMKPTAYLVNVARGAVVDEPALIAALRAGRIAGAALDVFEQEPVAPDNPLLAMPNVIATPHALCWTDENFDAIARAGLGSIADFARHRVPANVVNRGVLQHPDAAAWFAGSAAAADPATASPTDTTTDTTTDNSRRHHHV